MLLLAVLLLVLSLELHVQLLLMALGDGFLLLLG